MIVQIRFVCSQSRITPTKENGFSVRLLAENSGHVTVRLTVTPSSGSRLQLRGGKQLTDTVQIKVELCLHTSHLRPVYVIC